MVAAEKSGVQAEPPSELTHVARMSAKVLSFEDSVTAPVGSAGPGARPVPVSTRLLATAKALLSPDDGAGAEELREGPGGGYGGDLVDHDIGGTGEIAAVAQRGHQHQRGIIGWGWKAGIAAAGHDVDLRGWGGALVIAGDVKDSSPIRGNDVGRKQVACSQTIAGGASGVERDRCAADRLLAATYPSLKRRPSEAGGWREGRHPAARQPAARRCQRCKHDRAGELRLPWVAVRCVHEIELFSHHS